MTCDEALFRARVRETAGPRYPSSDWDGATIGSPDLTTNASHLARPTAENGNGCAGDSPPVVASRSITPSPGAAGPSSGSEEHA